ncbi:MAG: carbohydrate ABC transporter permease [Lachnospiraceae bacterium]|nr:carbohydrate ABC transporter permease [Lachnospiraceae bacterium]
MQTKRKKKRISDKTVFFALGYGLILLLTVFCLLPFLLILSGSFTEQSSLLTDGYRLIPKVFSLEAYQFLFRVPGDMLRAYGVTIFVTFTGTVSSLFITSMAAFVLANKSFRYRNVVSFFFYFTTVFGGGLVPWYIFNIKYLHFKNNYISLLLPLMVNATYLLILKSYMKNIPDEVYESAKLDGAGDWTIYWRIALPLSKAGLATVGLFTALAYWNDWYDAMLFIDDAKMYPLQYYLNDILNKSQGMAAAAAQAGIPAAQIPTEPVKLAMTVIATGPIILLYPFLQKYFVKGVTIGAVKG